LPTQILFIVAKSLFGTIGPKAQSGPRHVAETVLDPVTQSIADKGTCRTNETTNQPSQIQCNESHSGVPSPAVYQRTRWLLAPESTPRTHL